jgi:quercetin 2,3-dioxygenase
MTFDVRRAGDRFVTRREGIELLHSFSFGEHYDSGNVSFGLLLALNEMLLAPGAGFEMHEHRDIEIVTWVVSGSLQHRDSAGSASVIGPGMAQRLSAGHGVLHSEMASPSDAARVVQMWMAPEESGIEPSYEQRNFTEELKHGGLVPIASGDPRHESALRIHQPDATLYAARLSAEAPMQLPAASYVHVFVTQGSVTVEGIARLGCGEAARLSNSRGHRVTTNVDAEILVWEMLSAL